MRSKPLQEAHQVAEAYDRRLNEIARKERNMDPRFNTHAVQVIHDEGTTMFFHSAFVLRWGIWQIIIAEHHDIHIFPLDEARVQLFKRADEDVTELIDDTLKDLGIDPGEFEWGPDPYGDLKRKAEEEAAWEAEEAEAEDSTP